MGQLPCNPISRSPLQFDVVATDSDGNASAQSCFKPGRAEDDVQTRLGCLSSAGPQTVEWWNNQRPEPSETLDGRTRHSGPILVGLNRLAENIVNRRLWLSALDRFGRFDSSGGRFASPHLLFCTRLPPLASS